MSLPPAFVFLQLHICVYGYRAVSLCMDSTVSQSKQSCSPTINSTVATTKAQT